MGVLALLKSSPEPNLPEFVEVSVHLIHSLEDCDRDMDVGPPIYERVSAGDGFRRNGEVADLTRPLVYISEVQLLE